MTATDRIRALRFEGSWRRYQTLALEAFERDLAAGVRQTHIVAPPGSGKTLIGVEIVRRLQAPALVLAPNTAVQAQWRATVARFGADHDTARTDTAAPIACLTYQSLCQLDDPDAVITALADRRWATERAASTTSTVDAVLADAATWTGQAAERRRRERAAVAATIKREIARAEHGDLAIGDLLSQTVRGRLTELAANGVRTVVLDECHHLASLWGYVVRAVIEELGDVHLVGLTATPPAELTRDEAELYGHLLGPVDFTVPTPAVVRDGFLAPYQELAWLTQPLEGELRWLTERDLRFRELVTALHADPDGPWSFPAWVTHRMRERRRGGEDRTEVSWASFVRAAPDLAAAGARFLASAGLELPEGVPHGEAYRTPPHLDDWLVLLEDYALRCLGAQSDPMAAARYDAIAAALRELGYVLSRKGLRQGSSQVDRLLTASAAKSLALIDVVATELDARGPDLRALVLVDTEQPRAAPDPELIGVIRDGAGTAGEAVRTLAADQRTAVVRPLLVSGRGVRCAPDDAQVVAQALSRPDRAVRAEPDDEGLVRMVSDAPGWTAATWVAAATEAFTTGAVRVLIGTRGMLGEGWDAPCVNVVVDMTAATTSVAVTQMRGRSLRLDPEAPDKIASNWDIVCVAPGLTRGEADYDRFVRKHLHVFAPCEDGVIEAGPSHVHPALGPFAPPPADRFATINRQVAARAIDHSSARERWQLGQAYVGAEIDSVVVRSVRSTEPAELHPLDHPPSFDVALGGPLVLGGSALTAALAIGTFVTPVGWAALAGIPAAAAWGWIRAHRASANRLEEALPIDYAAAAIRDAYVELGEITAAAGASLAIEPRASGYLRVWLRDADPNEAALFATALDDLLDPATPPRYLVSRPVPLPGKVRQVLRATMRRRWAASEWVPVPADLGRRKDRAEVFARAAARWLGPGELIFTGRSDEGHAALGEAGAAATSWEPVRRRVWM